MKRDGWCQCLLELREIKADGFAILETWFVGELNERKIIYGTRKRWNSSEMGYVYMQRINWTTVLINYMGEIRNVESSLGCTPDVLFTFETTDDLESDSSSSGSRVTYRKIEVQKKQYCKNVSFSNENKREYLIWI